MKVSELIDQGADRIEEDGWFGGRNIEGKGRHDTGRNCIMTAVIKDDSRRINESPAIRLLEQAITDLHPDASDARMHRGKTWHNVVAFNNHEGMNMQKALDVMRYAAKLARTEEERED
jgi:hypothetical protein